MTANYSISAGELNGRNQKPFEYASNKCVGSPNWNGGYTGYYGPYWDEQREKALTRDDNTCQRCGMTQEEHREKHDQGIHVHHISNKSEFEDYENMNELSNLVTLCSRCHKLLEGLPIDTGDL